jgi:ABC-2 type transport system ATP-binding protein
MGQKQQLIWYLPPIETFEMNRALFDVDRKMYAETLDELVALLDLAPILDQPARNLSLGQRMRAELAAALLHRPRLLFLDEPTIGLDVEVQATVRSFISAYNARHGATVLLTSHDMDDVAAIADRILLIDQGQLRFDGSLAELALRFGDGRCLTVRGGDGLQALGFTSDDARTWHRTVHGSDVNALLQAVLERAPSADVTVTDPPLEEVLRRAFGEGRAAKNA